MLKTVSIFNIYAKIRLLKFIGPKPEAALLRDMYAYMSFFISVRCSIVGYI